MIIANITTPLLGIVDTSVIGHLSHPEYLSGTALASLMISVMLWLLGFFRMTTTGLVAQAYGNNNPIQQLVIILQGGVIAFVIASLIIIFKHQLFNLFSSLMNQSESIQTSTQIAYEYYSIRIWALPVSLCNLILTGYLIGRGQTRPILYTALCCNIINIFADIIFVPFLGWGVAGVAYASVIAETSMLALLVYLIFPTINQTFHSAGFHISLIKQNFTLLLKLNQNLFVRALLLQAVLSFMTLKATHYGAHMVAVNALLMQFFLFASYTLDGIANALETQVGQFKNKLLIMQHWVKVGCFLGLIIAGVYSLIYFLFSIEIIKLLTSIELLQTLTSDYLAWVWLLPIISCLSFIFDGVYIGLAWGVAMRNTMLLASVVFFFAFTLTSHLENHALWFAFSLFLLTRGLLQLFWFRLYKWQT